MILQRLPKVELNGSTDDTISRNTKKDIAVKYPKCRDVCPRTIQLQNVIEKNYQKFQQKTLGITVIMARTI